MNTGLERAAERDFFLDEFRHRTLVISIGEVPGDGRDELAGLRTTVGLLQGNGSRALLVATDGGSLGAAALADAFDVAPVHAFDLDGHGASGRLADLWIGLDERGFAVVDASSGVPAADPAAVPHLVAACFATRLGADKLVLTDGAGGWGDPVQSFVHLSDAPDLRLGDRPAIADAVCSALDGDVATVNLCRLGELREELFTFDGVGTLFTRDAYLRVSRLTIDDLPVVEELVGRGVAEGFLRPRPRREVVKIALSGLGARIARSGHLAAIGSLETERYHASGLGEVTCLYTVNRFTGEGAAAELLDGLVTTAREDGLVAVFACTVSDHAARFFERHGFRSETQERVPDVKWTGYDPDRRSRIRVLWRALEET